MRNGTLSYLLGTKLGNPALPSQFLLDEVLSSD